MKHLNKILFGCIAMAMAACSSDEPAKGPVANEGDVHASLTLQLPSVTRSTTNETWDKEDGSNSNDGSEIGKDHENHVGSVLVVLVQNAGTDAAPAYKYVASSLTDSKRVSASTEPVYDVRFESSDLANYAGQKNIYVFAYCNPTSTIITNVEALTSGADYIVDATESIQDGDKEQIWSKNGFLMTNRVLSEPIEIPSKETLESTYNTASNPFDLGEVKVCRVVARFDFQQTTMANQSEPNLYPISDEVNGDLQGYVKITDMALMNLAKEFYYLPRVSADGQNTNAEICGHEVRSNWVVSPFAEKKLTAENRKAFAASGFFHNMLSLGTDGSYVTTPAENYNFVPVTSLSEEDRHEGWSGDGTDYRIWRYVTENTIPQLSTEDKYANQKNGISTGVVFRGKIVPVAGSAMETLMAEKKVLYAYNGTIYGDAESLKKIVDKNPVSRLKQAYDAAFVDGNIDANGDLIASNKTFTIYRPDTKGDYNVYYYYFNRHNDNGNNTVMGAMEFGTVRNNVYKLAVTNIMKFGRPGKPGDDPDPKDPEDPNEDPKTYFKVSCRVLPWVVRINNIVLE